MNQVLHLLKKDLRALRLPLMLLYALLLAQIIFALQDPLIVDRALAVTSARGLLQLLSLLAMLVTTGLLVHQEPLVGTTAFWLTRPIWRGSLLKAKALFLAVFIVGPYCGATLAVAFAFGLGLADLPAAFASFVLPLLTVLTGAVLLAAVTPSLVVYMMTWIGLLFASHLITALVSLATAGDSFGVSSASRDVVWMIALTILGGPLVTYQYLTGRTRRTVVGISVGVVAAVVMSQAWPWEVVEWSNPLFEQSPVSLSLTPGDQSEAFYASRRSDDEMSVAAPAMFIGHDSYAFMVQGVKGELRFPDHSAAKVVAEQFPTPITRVITGLEEFRWLNEHKPPLPVVNLRTRGPAPFDDLIGKSGTLQADVYGQAYLYDLVGTMPLTAGAWFEKGPIAAVIRETSQSEAELRFVLRHRHIQKAFQDVRYPRIALINSARKEMSVVGSTAESFLPPFGVFYWGPVVVSREETYLFPLRSPEGEPLITEREWLADAEIGILEWRSEGRYKTSLRVTDFRTRDAAIDAQARTSSVAN